MIDDEKPEADATIENEEEACPHCGAVLDVARAIESDRSLLRARRAQRDQ